MAFISSVYTSYTEWTFECKGGTMSYAEEKYRKYIKVNKCHLQSKYITALTDYLVSNRRWNRHFETHLLYKTDNSYFFLF